MKLGLVYNILMGYSWYTRNSDQASPDNIHQVLAYGTLEDIKTLNQEIGKDIVTESFLKNPKKVYTPASLNFIKNYILNITSFIDEQKYLKNTPRNIR